MIGFGGNAQAQNFTINSWFGPDCISFVRYQNIGTKIIIVSLKTDAIDYVSGATFWWARFQNNPNNVPISETVIADCLGTTASSIANFIQVGAENVAFEDQPDMGYEFTLLNDTPIANAGSYIYYVSGFSYPAFNDAPSADAGLDQSVTSGDVVTLVAGGVDLDGGLAGYAWTRIGGTGLAANAVLSDATIAGPTFTDNSIGIGGADVTHIFSLLVTDDNGATSPAADTVTITIIAPLDTESPVIAPIANINAPAISGGTTASVAFSASVSDNYDTGLVPIFSLNGNIISSPYVFSLGHNTITINAADVSGNDATPISFTVTILDQENPVITPVANITVTADSGVATTSVAFSTSVSDNADSGLIPSFSLNGSLISSPHVFSVGVNTVTISAADHAGNAATTSFTVMVSDTETPVILPVTNIAVSTDSGAATASVTFSTSVSDNADNGLVPIFTVGGNPISSPHTFALGQSIITVNAADNAGNAAAAISFTVTVADTESPVIASRTNISVSANSGETTASVAFSTSVSDNVDTGLAPIFSLGGSQITSPYTFPLGQSTVIINAADSAGNDAIQIGFTVTVSDAETPVIALITNIAVSADSGTATKSVVFSTTVSDNYDTGLLPVFSLGGNLISSPHIFSVGINTVTINAIDTAGNNAAPVIFTITVADIEIPVITPVANIAVPTNSGAASASVAFSTTVSDNYDTGLVPVFSLGSSPVTSPYIFPLGQNTVTINATDSAGNSAAPGHFTVTVSDAEIPVITPVADITVSAGRSEVTVSVAFSTSVFDNVDTGLIPVFSLNGSVITSPYIFPLGQSTVMITAADNVGNAAIETTFQVTVNDITSPDVTLSSTVGENHNDSFIVVAQFTEEITGFEASDIIVTNGYAENLQAGATYSYSFTVVPVADGETTVSIAPAVVVDLVGRPNTISNTITVSVDQTAPTIVISGPNGTIVDEFSIAIITSEGLTGFTAEDITVQNGSVVAGSFTGGPLNYSLRITPEVGKNVAIFVAANVTEDVVGNMNMVSNVFTAQTGSPASEFTKAEAEISTIVAKQAARTLTSTIIANRRMIRSARTRFMLSQRQISGEETGLVSRNNVGFTLRGHFKADRETISTKGTFFQQNGTYDGTKRRLFWGTFDAQHDSETGATTATLTGRVAWEKKVSDRTMLGYFIGAELGRSQISGAFSGDQNSLGLSVGAYGVTQLSEGLFADGFVTLGAARNRLDMSTDVLALTSEYMTQSISFGGAITGVIEKERFEIWPELSFGYGRTHIENMHFTGQAYGLTDNNLSLGAGSVELGSLMLRSEFRLAWNDGEINNTLITFSPRLICEILKLDTTEKNCGGGFDFGFDKSFRDGSAHFNAKVSLDRVGNSTRPSLQVNLKHEF